MKSLTEQVNEAVFTRVKVRFHNHPTKKDITQQEVDERVAFIEKEKGSIKRLLDEYLMLVDFYKSTKQKTFDLLNNRVNIIVNSYSDRIINDITIECLRQQASELRLKDLL